MKRSIILFFVLLAVQYGWSQGTGYWILPSKNIDGLNYFLFEETGEVMIADENCWEGELVLPTTVNWDEQDYPLRYLTSRAFADCKALTRVVIPETVQNIRFYSDYLGELNLIKAPFQGCTQLESIDVAEDNQWLCSVDGVLYNHEKTQLFNYPPGAARSHFAIPEGVEAIGTAAFRGSVNLTSVSFPNTVTQIYDEAFYDCVNLEQISLPDNISTIRLSTFRGCSKLKNIHLPDNLTEIENVAFYECSSLKEIVFPEKLQTLGYRVFQGCQLENIVIKGYLYDYSIQNLLPCLGESTKLYVPASEVERYKSLFVGDVRPLEDYNKDNIHEKFPEGTKWTEIRLDTLKYDNWYSKVGEGWIPNFEIIEYRVQGKYADYLGSNYMCVYSDGPEWTDSLAFVISDNGHWVLMSVITDYIGMMLPTVVYHFDWSVGQVLGFQEILVRNATCFPPCGCYNYGIIEEIKEGYFGGVRPLKYVDLDGKGPIDTDEPWYEDTNGGRIIQGIGITEWNDGECLFGPPNPNLPKTGTYGERHYRSMLVHFERDGEVLYDVWPEKEATTEVTFTKDQMATIILPTEPEASKGKYYRLDRVENGQIVFEQELQPQAHVPYIIVPNEDFSIDPSALDLEGLSSDAVSIEGIRFVGSYMHKEFNSPEDRYVDIIDTTPDCQGNASCTGAFVIGTLRAYLEVDWAKVGWNDPIDHGGARVPWEKMEIVLRNDVTSIRQVEKTVNGKSSNGKCFDLQGRSLPSKPTHGIYIEKGRKKAIK